MASLTIKEAVSAAKKEGVAMAGTFGARKTLPKTKLGKLVDELHDLRDQRLAINKVVEAMKAEEQRLTDHIIETVDADTEGGAIGKRFKAIIVRDFKPVIEDYEQFTAHIQKTGEFDLLNRALNAAAFKARAEEGVAVPGIGSFQYKKLSITKVK